MLVFQKKKREGFGVLVPPCLNTSNFFSVCFRVSPMSYLLCNSNWLINNIPRFEFYFFIYKEKKVKVENIVIEISSSIYI